MRFHEEVAQNELNKAWEEVQSKLLFPLTEKHPYYISAPPWIRTSAGIRALYLLCHALNKSGYSAYMTNHPHGEYYRFAPWTNGELFAPMLSEYQAKSHFKQGLCPILVYPETVSGNPLQAQVVMRWVMNFPGLLGGDDRYAENEICFGYSRELAIAIGQPDQILHLPTIDTRIFYPIDGTNIRKGGCFFATKYKAFTTGDLSSITDGCFEITRDLPDSLNPRELADLLRRSEVFYAYENTALATEAVICGCPAVFIANPHMTEVIGREELGKEGYAWGTDPMEIKRAKETVEQGAINYYKTYNLFWEQLDQFIEISQNRAQLTSYTKMILIPSWPVIPSWFQKQLQRGKKELRRFTRRLKRHRYSFGFWIWQIENRKSTYQIK